MLTQQRELLKKLDKSSFNTLNILLVDKKEHLNVVKDKIFSDAGVVILTCKDVDIIDDGKEFKLLCVVQMPIKD